MEFVFYPKKDFQEKNIRNGKNIKKVIIYGQESNTSEGSKAFKKKEIIMSKLENFLFSLDLKNYPKVFQELFLAEKIAAQ